MDSVQGSLPPGSLPRCSLVRDPVCPSAAFLAHLCQPTCPQDHQHPFLSPFPTRPEACQAVPPTCFFNSLPLDTEIRAQCLLCPLQVCPHPRSLCSPGALTVPPRGQFPGAKGKSGTCLPGVSGCSWRQRSIWPRMCSDKTLKTRPTCPAAAGPCGG